MEKVERFYIGPQIEMPILHSACLDSSVTSRICRRFSHRMSHGIETIG